MQRSQLHAFVLLQIHLSTFQRTVGTTKYLPGREFCLIGRFNPQHSGLARVVCPYDFSHGRLRAALAGDGLSILSVGLDRVAVTIHWPTGLEPPDRVICTDDIPTILRCNAVDNIGRLARVQI